MNENEKYCKDVVEELERIYFGEQLNEEGELVTLCDYFQDALDFEYTINSRKEYKSVRVWVTLGGPNVWIDTNDSFVRLAWGTSREEYPLRYEISEEIDSIFKDYYCCY